MDKKDLLALINDDDLGLLDIEKKSVSATPDDRLSESFLEVNEFYSLHNAEPRTGGDIHEHKLASRLKHIRENKEQRDFLSKYDTHNLLKTEKKDLDSHCATGQICTRRQGLFADWHGCSLKESVVSDGL